MNNDTKWFLPFQIGHYSCDTKRKPKPGDSMKTGNVEKEFWTFKHFQCQKSFAMVNVFHRER